MGPVLVDEGVNLHYLCRYLGKLRILLFDDQNPEAFLLSNMS